MSAGAWKGNLESLGGLTCLVAAREGEAPRQAVVLCHGFGAPGTDLVPVAGELPVPQGTIFVFPQAPLELPWGFDARAWWMVDLDELQRALATGSPRSMAHREPAGMPEARQALTDLLADLKAAHGVSPADVVLGGFSQGAMTSLDVALHAGTRLRGLLLWSTTMLAEEEWSALMPALSGTPAFLSHGMQDPLLPFEVSERLKDRLVAAGWDVTWHPFRGVHQIPASAIEGSAAFLARVLG